MSRRRSGTARIAAVTVAVTVAAALLGACGASPVSQPPTGIDGLTVPTPSPTPADFVSGVDNPWLPLAPGTRWTYDRYTPGGSDTLTATVLADPHRIAGVDTTGVLWEQRLPSGRTTPLSVRWYAQDTAGNVWWFGQRVIRRIPRVDPLTTRSWSAGRHGAEAGLAVAAEPRVGDGYANAFCPGVVESRSTVLSVDATVAIPTRTYDGTLATRDLSPLAPTTQVESYYEPGTGLVAQQATEALSTDLSLVRVQRP